MFCTELQFFLPTLDIATMNKQQHCDTLTRRGEEQAISNKISYDTWAIKAYCNGKTISRFRLHSRTTGRPDSNYMNIFARYATCTIVNVYSFARKTVNCDNKCECANFPNFRDIFLLIDKGILFSWFFLETLYIDESMID